MYLTGAVYSLDGSDSLKETMQTSIESEDQVSISPNISFPTLSLFHTIDRKCYIALYRVNYIFKCYVLILIFLKKQNCRTANLVIKHVIELH